MYMEMIFSITFVDYTYLHSFENERDDYILTKCILFSNIKM